MREIIRMIVVLTVISTVCGLVLSGYRRLTAERIEQQVLMNVQGPRVEVVLQGADNDLIADRKKIQINGKDLLVFIGKKKGGPYAVAYETVGKGFGGDIKVMVGYDLDLNTLTGVQIISHKETPGVGSRVEGRQFTRRFRGLHVNTDVPPNQCPEEIDAISGATYSSLGVCEALRKSLALLPKVKKRLQAFEDGSRS